MQIIDTQSETTQAVVLAPTRELAKQISMVMTALGQYLGIKVYVCTGGTDVRNERKNLKETNYHVIVGTPGRVKDMITKKFISTDHVKIFVLDEADQMLGRGFKEQIAEMLQQFPAEVQVALFSATMPQEILEITK